jgi:16S rRNA (guanine527-N7)-methyltransferase
LTGLRRPADIVQHLFRDSLLFLSCIPGGAQTVADIGAGAGIPGIPLAISRPEISVTLMEAKRKRASFLRAVQRELGAPNISVIEGRAGTTEIGARLECAFDVVVSRAVGALHELLPIAMRYLKAGGVFVASGPPDQASMTRTALPAGIEPITIRIPELGSARTFLTAKKKDIDQVG